MKPSIKHPKLNPESFPEAKALATLVGEFIEHWGFKAVQGKIWCYLFLSKRPLNSRELAELAEVSPALITQSVKILLDYKVILEAGKGPNGMLLFIANPNAATAIRDVLAGREVVLLHRIGQAAQKLAAQKSARAKKSKNRSIELDSVRFEKMIQWIAMANGLLAAGLELLSEETNPFSAPEKFAQWPL